MIKSTLSRINFFLLILSYVAARLYCVFSYVVPKIYIYLASGLTFLIRRYSHLDNHIALSYICLLFHLLHQRQQQLRRHAQLAMSNFFSYHGTFVSQRSILKALHYGYVCSSIDSSHIFKQEPVYVCRL